MPPRRAKTDAVFEFPEIQSKRKPLSATSKSIYKSYLNKLAGKGIKTVKDLQTQEKTVITAIQELFPDKQKQKTVLYAVFYALTDTGHCNSENHYYWFLQSLKSDDDPSKSEDLRYLYED